MIHCISLIALLILLLIICLHTVIWHQAFQSNANNVHSIIWFEVFQRRSLYSIMIQ